MRILVSTDTLALGTVGREMGFLEAWVCLMRLYSARCRWRVNRFAVWRNSSSTIIQASSLSMPSFMNNVGGGGGSGEEVMGEDENARSALPFPFLATRKLLVPSSRSSESEAASLGRLAGQGVGLSSFAAFIGFAGVLLLSQGSFRGMATSKRNGGMVVKAAIRRGVRALEALFERAQLAWFHYHHGRMVSMNICLGRLFG